MNKLVLENENIGKLKALLDNMPKSDDCVGVIYKGTRIGLSEDFSVMVCEDGHAEIINSKDTDKVYEVHFTDDTRVVVIESEEQ